MNEVVTLNMANPVAASRIGSVAALVVAEDGDKRFFLTCSHVALGGSPQDKGGILTTPIQISILDHDQRIGSGQLTYAQRNDKVDVALVQVNAPLTKRSNLLPDGRPLQTPVSRNSLASGQKVGFYSSLRGQLVWGKIQQIVSDRTISLDYGSEICTFTGLLVLSDDSGVEPMSKKGDSGSLLFTEDLSPFGILIGGGDLNDYAMDLTEVLNLTQTTFV